MIRKNQELIKELSIAPPDYQDLSFPTKYSQKFYGQCIANFWKQYRSYWKNPPYNAMRYLMTFLFGLVFGTVFWQKGKNVYGPSYFDAVFETKIVGMILYISFYGVNNNFNFFYDTQRFTTRFV